MMPIILILGLECCRDGSSASLIAPGAERHGEQNSKGEPGGGGDEQQNGERHGEGGEQEVGGHRVPILDDNDRDQDSQARGGDEFKVSHKAKTVSPQTSSRRDASFPGWRLLVLRRYPDR
jgi:hypothetical protein